MRYPSSISISGLSIGTTSALPGSGGFGPSLQEDLAKKRAAELKEELNEQSEVMEFALHENCMLRIKLQDAGINPDGILNADQQLRAQHEFETRLAWLNQDLKGRKRLARKKSAAQDEPASESN